LLLRWRAEWTTRFFALLAYLTASIPMIDAFLGRHFVPQPPRYQPLMEIALALFIVFALRPLLEKLSRPVKAALAVFLLTPESGRRYDAEDLALAEEMARRAGSSVGVGPSQSRR